MKAFAFLPLMYLLLSCEPNQPKPKVSSTKELARDMFREPAGNEEKIPSRFQPIDHAVKQPGNQE